MCKNLNRFVLGTVSNNMDGGIVSWVPTGSVGTQIARAAGCYGTQRVLSAFPRSPYSLGHKWELDKGN
jgi:hypothetical protein